MTVPCSTASLRKFRRRGRHGNFPRSRFYPTAKSSPKDVCKYFIPFRAAPNPRDKKRSLTIQSSGCVAGVRRVRADARVQEGVASVLASH